MSCVISSYDQLLALVDRPGGPERTFIALAGPPAAGKSYLAERLRLDLNQRGHVAAVVEMDGFHYDDRVLDERGVLARKGAPDTFDIAGLHNTIQRLKAGGDVAVPVFDRSLEISRAGARIVTADTTHVVIEGLYLLLEDAPWNVLLDHYDLSILLRPADGVIRRRLEHRWKDLSVEDRTIKIEQNDLPNASVVAERSIKADIVFTGARD